MIQLSLSQINAQMDLPPPQIFKHDAKLIPYEKIFPN